MQKKYVFFLILKKKIQPEKKNFQMIFYLYKYC